MTDKQPTLRLRDQIPSTLWAGRAVVDAPELDALARLVEGSLDSGEELERCEEALRALLLHTSCIALDPARPLPDWLTAAPALIIDAELPTLRCSGDDPSVPAELLTDLTASAVVFDRYQNAPTERFATGPDGAIALAEVGDAAPRDPPPAMRALLVEADRVERRAERLLIGYLGGASVIASVDAQEEWAGVGHAIPLLLKRLDAWFDPASRTPGAALPFLSLRPLLAALLARAPRGQLPTTIRELHGKLQRAVSDLHTALIGFEESAAAPRTPAERVDRLEALLGAARRIDILTGSDDAPRRVRIRGLSPAAAGWLARAADAGGITAELSRDIARLIADSTDDHRRRLSPSLANSLPGRDPLLPRIPSMTLLKRHLATGQLEAVQHASRRR